MQWSVKDLRAMEARNNLIYDYDLIPGRVIFRNYIIIIQIKDDPIFINEGIRIVPFIYKNFYIQIE